MLEIARIEATVISPKAVLTEEELAMGRALGLLENNYSSRVPLWVVAQLDWSMYLAQDSSLNGLTAMMCVDIDECREGIRGNGILHDVCVKGAECCENTIGSHNCHTKKSSGLRRFCGSGQVDMTTFLNAA